MKNWNELKNYEKAVILDKIMRRMNDEYAFECWLYAYPDGETEEDAMYDFEEAEDYNELEEDFIRIYKHYHRNGLYSPSAEVVYYCNYWDEKLALKAIEVF